MMDGKNINNQLTLINMLLWLPYGYQPHVI